MRKALCSPFRGVGGLLLLAAFTASAGVKVVEKGSDNPVIFAFVTDANGKAIGNTDNSGFLPAFALGSDTVVLHHMRYKPVTVAIADLADGRIELEPINLPKPNAITPGDQLLESVFVRSYLFDVDGLISFTTGTMHFLIDKKSSKVTSFIDEALSCYSPSRIENCRWTMGTAVNKNIAPMPKYYQTLSDKQIAELYKVVKNGNRNDLYTKSQPAWVGCTITDSAQNIITRSMDFYQLDRIYGNVSLMKQINDTCLRYISMSFNVEEFENVASAIVTTDDNGNRRPLMTQVSQLKRTHGRDNPDSTPKRVVTEIYYVDVRALSNKEASDFAKQHDKMPVEPPSWVQPINPVLQQHIDHLTPVKYERPVEKQFF